MPRSAAEPGDIAEVFATHWPRLVARLVRDLGDVGLAEDCAAEAFTEASRLWPESGMPDRPAGWLHTVARRRAVDSVRRSARLRQLLPQVLLLTEHQWQDRPAMNPQEVDDHLSLLLGCVHPALSEPARVALTLRIVGGLSTAQIAQAFFVSEATMTRRLTRAKAKIRDAGIPFTRSDRETLQQRLPAVRAVVYSIFTEGHLSTTSPELVRGDLCDEAIWLGELLVQLVPTDPEVAGLLALMLLHDARRAGRVDSSGAPVLLAEQDRSTWDRQMIARALALLEGAHARGRGGPYQYQAAIAALHACSPSFEDTDWRAILALYDVLLSHQPSTVVAVNRAVAVRYVHGPRAGLEILEDLQIAAAGGAVNSAAYHGARAEMLSDLGRWQDSVAAFDAALATASNGSQQRLLRRRRDEVAAPGQ
ncbi:MAG TPA: sigma-70 family RNA polymerase sigma factor [Ornithinimicrobium sp.]|uniref:RNA polymerase sigma factor n=1 Tax=Ornithinimicrobium sp. TaxID=1977084 RepID=UPI002B468479|nr:sigma-70 family RNA polymerase sigma factor [Ornithinimicrobium sp.]HKJ11863.1 sigma-70 family RNA polymerase sigma factor [Ornithinimicrobium sp.]